MRTRQLSFSDAIFLLVGALIVSSIAVVSAQRQRAAAAEPAVQTT